MALTSLPPPRRTALAMAAALPQFLLQPLAFMSVGDHGDIALAFALRRCYADDIAVKEIAMPTGVYERKKKGWMKSCPICGSDFYVTKSRETTFCSSKCYGHSMKGRRAPAATRIGLLKAAQRQGWRDRYSDGRYIRICRPHHPAATRSGYVYEHRTVIEAALGRYLEKDEVVHHKNGCCTDNRPCNLELMSVSEHAVYSAHQRWHP